MPDVPQHDETNYQVRDPEQFAHNLSKVAERTSDLLSTFMAQGKNSGEKSGLGDELQRMATIFFDLSAQMASDPQQLGQAGLDFWQRHISLWQSSLKKFTGEEVSPVIEPQKGDRRFRDDDWQDNPVFDFIKQSYLLTADWAHEVVDHSTGLDEHSRQKADFYTTQIANALSPSNFVFTNPEVLRETFATNGANLVEGIDNLAEDIERGKGKLAIRQTDMDAFEVGGNLGITPGKVVYQNELMQLIQYAPSTPNVFKKPLLIVPPWINKYYILDLNPEKSFVKWCVDQGHTVFIISWVNPGPELSSKGFDDYMSEGILTALDTIEITTGEKEINAIGYCVGGTLLAMTLAYMAATEDKRITSATFFTTQIDFEMAGELLVFVDEEQIDEIEGQMAEKGVFEGRKMANAFNLLRSNDLIWSYVVNNYLLGKDPFPFDLLFWNSDSTSMPASVHSSYLRNCYLDNNLAKGRMTLKDVKIDFARIKIPVYNLATREDHIAPAKSVYKGSKLFGGPVKNVLAASGHIAGVVNPPAKQKYEYWTSNARPATLEKWLEKAHSHPGSWWPDWGKWMSRKSGPKVEARTPGGPLGVIEDAPGSYVKKKAQ
jgi:poly[(R)-3-hydroxyalkanoate] polymerase subunit PhaC